MALVASIHVENGWKMPEFTLQDAQGETHHLSALAGKKGLLVVFTCNHCPYAQAVWPRLIRHAQTLQTMGVNTVAINPNINPRFPDDSVPEMQKKIVEWGIHFPYLVDDTQAVAAAFDAQCTPDLYLFNGEGELFYHGRIDDYWKDEARVTKEELMPAAALMVEGAESPKVQYPTIGCSIKWFDGHH
ncbi:MAG: thioredoxin family protein [Zetaproteobacteria bacterium]|nr:thioredoxin family protein [Zetaproteobacteria bacterium]